MHNLVQKLSSSTQKHLLFTLDAKTHRKLKYALNSTNLNLFHHPKGWTWRSIRHSIYPCFILASIDIILNSITVWRWERPNLPAFSAAQRRLARWGEHEKDDIYIAEYRQLISLFHDAMFPLGVGRLTPVCVLQFLYLQLYPSHPLGLLPRPFGYRSFVLRSQPFSELFPTSNLHSTVQSATFQISL